MYVSITGLKTKGVTSWVRFIFLTIPAFNEAKKADGILFCETTKRGNEYHTLTVWESKQKMMIYRKSPAHLKAMKAFSSIATGKVYGYECDNIPSWEDALEEYDLKARDVT